MPSRKAPSLEFSASVSCFSNMAASSALEEEEDFALEVR